jgi:hypothetical protein
MITFKAVEGHQGLRKLIYGMQPYFNPTRRNMEDDLNVYEKMQPKTIKSKTNICLKRKDDFILFFKEDNQK